MANITFINTSICKGKALISQASFVYRCSSAAGRYILGNFIKNRRTNESETAVGGKNYAEGAVSFLFVSTIHTMWCCQSSSERNCSKQCRAEYEKLKIKKSLASIASIPFAPPDKGQGKMWVKTELFPSFIPGKLFKNIARISALANSDKKVVQYEKIQKYPGIF